MTDTAARQERHLDDLFYDVRAGFREAGPHIAALEEIEAALAAANSRAVEAEREALEEQRAANLISQVLQETQVRIRELEEALRTVRLYAEQDYHAAVEEGGDVLRCEEILAGIARALATSKSEAEAGERLKSSKSEPGLARHERAVQRDGVLGPKGPPRLGPSSGEQDAR